jgi:hypothetical protein
MMLAPKGFGLSAAGGIQRRVYPTALNYALCVEIGFAVSDDTQFQQNLC